MKAFFDPRQREHDPKHFLLAGVRRQNHERPARVDGLLEGLAAAGIEAEPPGDAGLGPIAAVHTPEYVAFLQGIHARWREIDGADEEVIPNVHPLHRGDSYPTSAVGQAGFHMADLACPIGARTWHGAYASAQCAVAGARAVLGGERAAYALCRPPSHHASMDVAAGSCFLNNTAIGASLASAAGRRVAIVDVDLHHGNGTQAIFHARGDVLTVSVHADPSSFYPFFQGHAHERGEGAGLGANLNLPLPKGSGDDVFLDALGRGLDRVAAFGADLLVVALGLDAHEGDPYAGLAVTTGGFGRIGAALAAAELPTLLVQEGGYLNPALGRNLAAVLQEFG